MNLPSKKTLMITLIAVILLTMLIPINARGIVSTEETNLNVRIEPDIESDIIASLTKGTYVELISYEDGWWYLSYEKGKYGYCSEEYITELNSTVVFDMNGDYVPVALDIVDYKQYDTRWNKLKVGYSGQNIHNIGCTLTSVAMVESYINDKEITPADIVKTFSFTSGGAIYWTKNYRTNWSKNYLETIYYELIQGNPVIIEAKTCKNVTHWVVVTGFTGGNELTADKFTINDPGSSKRTLLSDFFDMYPIYSKFVQVLSE